MVFLLISFSRALRESSGPEFVIALSCLHCSPQSLLIPDYVLPELCPWMQKNVGNEPWMESVGVIKQSSRVNDV